MRTGLFVGRFQPFHKGHLEAVRYALGRVDRLVVVIGSAQRNYEPRNPFTLGERIEMIWRVLRAEGLLDRVLMVPVPDVENHATWVRFVETSVPVFSIVFSNDPLTLELFRAEGYEAVEVPLLNRPLYMATEVRQRMANGGNWEDLVPPQVAEYLRSIGAVERVKRLLGGERSRP
ncbi:MAG: nicotinamide-nucleotide adenylyltransferase [Conexivisphaera sp.]